MKIRLDKLLVQKKLASNIKEAQALIGAGQVFVNNSCSDKAGTNLDIQSELRVKQKSRYVSRGGIKLEKGLHSKESNEKDVAALVRKMTMETTG